MGVGQAAVNATGRPFNPHPLTMKTILTILTESDAEIGARLHAIARRVAVAVAVIITLAHLVYQAGYITGRAIHTANDWLAQTIKNPERIADTVISISANMLAWADKVLKEEKKPDVINVLGATLLSEKQLNMEIEQFEKKKKVARRKPAKAREQVAAV